MSCHLVDDLSQNTEAWLHAGIALPRYGTEAVKLSTIEAPHWIHFGAGNLFRALHAPIADSLLNQGVSSTGIVVVETFDPQIIDTVYTPFHNRSLNVVLGNDGSFDISLIASVTDAIALRTHDENWEKLVRIFCNPSLQMVSLSITEKGYSTHDEYGQMLPFLADELRRGPAQAVSALAAITALLFERFCTITTPLSLVSTDNFSHNGEHLSSAIMEIASVWMKMGFVSSSFLNWLSDPTCVAFPCSMVDRITPNPASQIQAQLTALGVADTEITSTALHTNVAPFTNTEETWYLVIEDAFPNGRPDLERAGVFVTDKETVNKCDEMKVTSCLNPIHTALAVFGMLLALPTISQTISEPSLMLLVQRLGYNENLPVTPNPNIIAPEDFLKTVLTKRISNPNLPDTPFRIATDTSQKMPIRFGETLKKYAQSDVVHMSSLQAIPLVIAGWLRLVVGSDGLGIDDMGNSIELSPDPRLKEIQSTLSMATLGTLTDGIERGLHRILQDSSLFGIDLDSTPLAQPIIDCFTSFACGTGTVLPTIERVLRKSASDKA